MGSSIGVQAIPLLTLAIELTPNYAPAWIDSARVLCAIGATRAAVADMAYVLEDLFSTLVPEPHRHVEAWRRCTDELGNLLLALGHLPPAAGSGVYKVVHSASPRTSERILRLSHARPAEVLERLVRADETAHASTTSLASVIAAHELPALASDWLSAMSDPGTFGFNPRRKPCLASSLASAEGSESSRQCGPSAAEALASAIRFNRCGLVGALFTMVKQTLSLLTPQPGWPLPMSREHACGILKLLGTNPPLARVQDCLGAPGWPDSMPPRFEELMILLMGNGPHVGGQCMRFADGLAGQGTARVTLRGSRYEGLLRLVHISLDMTRVDHGDLERYDLAQQLERELGEHGIVGSDVGDAHEEDAQSASTYMSAEEECESYDRAGWLDDEFEVPGSGEEEDEGAEEGGSEGGGRWQRGRGGRWDRGRGKQ
jgi:hypothetical protein